jgi:hypothetical protein
MLLFLPTLRRPRRRSKKRAYAAHKGERFFEGFAGGQFGEDETPWKKEGLGIIVGRPPIQL